MSLFDKHEAILANAVEAMQERKFFTQYPEHPKPYGEEAPKKGEEWFKNIQNNKFTELLQTGESDFAGEEVSPYTRQPLGIKYPLFPLDDVIAKSQNAFEQWRNVDVDDRVGILIESLERIKERFFDIAHANMHTSGQSFMMSFQASGPHANDRALEAISMGYEELTRFPKKTVWEKPMGKFNLTMEKDYNPIPRGIGLVIGCSTFPVWNTVPGVYANLITGNSVIIKPHPKAVLPIAIVVAEIQKALQDAGYNINLIQLATDVSDNLITTHLAEHKLVKLIDYTGGSQFGEYVESLEGKVSFTEKAGVNSVIIDSVKDIDAVMQNLAFSVCLYSGQMCTAPQNFFIPEGGLTTEEGHLSYDDVVQKLKANIVGIIDNPKMGAGTLGAIQNENTFMRVKHAADLGCEIILNSKSVKNEEFPDALTCSPAILEIEASKKDVYQRELFGPIILVIKTKNTDHSIELAKEMAEKHGAITCAAYTTDEVMMRKIQTEMNSVYAPVSFNLTGFVWVNQHAAFSDLHVTGGNPAGNASFTDPLFILRRFLWVGNRKIKE